ncbi:hypothetical protein CYMTET_23363 [Cymbomonas tetramitiformis]|uniref:Uncharacterized protein n=1 Tax=Cymbomonas tetramitiformis TaxID=36881 RepID=A0AAE0L1A2_9CHLO|nr:hypothetical protein CYMTET_23363 [Cymbomonas tetramitiformis]
MCSPGITFYQHGDFEGWSAHVGPGSHCLSELKEEGFVNDDMSAMIVDEGFQVVLFENDGFKGWKAGPFPEGRYTCQDLQEMDSHFKNDRCSSCKVKFVGGDDVDFEDVVDDLTHDFKSGLMDVMDKLKDGMGASLIDEARPGIIEEATSELAEKIVEIVEEHIGDSDSSHDSDMVSDIEDEIEDFLKGIKTLKKKNKRKKHSRKLVRSKMAELVDILGGDDSCSSEESDADSEDYDEDIDEAILLAKKQKKKVKKLKRKKKELKAYKGTCETIGEMVGVEEEDSSDGSDSEGDEEDEEEEQEEYEEELIMQIQYVPSPDLNALVATY